MTRTIKITAGDVVIKRSSGQLDVSIENKPKARQAMRRLLSLNAPQGAGINALMSGVPKSSFAFSARVQRAIRAAFDELVRSQQEIQRLDRTPEERLSQIVRMLVTPARFKATPSKTGYALRVDAVTVAGQSVTEGGTLIPGGG